MTAQVTGQVTVEVTAQVAAFCREPRSAKQIIAELGLKHWKTFQNNYLLPLIGMRVLERTVPDKARSRMHRYRTTEARLAILRTHHQIPSSSARRKAAMPRGTQG